MALELNEIPLVRYDRALHSQGVHPMAETVEVDLQAIAYLSDAALRNALVDQARSEAADEQWVNYVVANEDGSYRHTMRIPRGSLNLPLSQR